MPHHCYYPKNPFPCSYTPFPFDGMKALGTAPQAWPSPQGVKKLFLPLPTPAQLFLSPAVGRGCARPTAAGTSGGEGWGRAGEPGTARGLLLCSGEARGHPGVMGLRTAMPLSRV